MDINEKLASFQDLVLETSGLSLWKFDGEGNLVATNCPHELVFLPVLKYNENLQYLASVKERVPILMTSDTGFAWIATRQYEEEECVAMYLVGPLLLAQFDPDMIERRQKEKFGQRSGGQKWRAELIASTRELPILDYPIVAQYAVILHYCVTGERVLVSNLHCQEDAKKTPARKPKGSLAQAYRNQTAIIQMVRDGDSNYASVMSSIQKAVSVPDYTNDGLSNVKISCTMLTSLCVRAAVEGGVSAELSYDLGNQYISEIWKSHSVSGVGAVKNRMFEDFVARVQKLRKNEKYSPVVRNCVDYIESHTEEKLNIEAVADRLSYTKYYLSRRFKAETGYSINEYIKIAKIEHAKTLLITTQESVDSIADRLCFASRSYFSDTFKKITGMSATQYRAKYLDF